jgi:hypothetical protein
MCGEPGNGLPAIVSGSVSQPLREVVRRAIIIGSPGSFSGIARSTLAPVNLVTRLREPCGALGYHWSGQGQAVNDAAGLDDEGKNGYY